jgi:hypothetical protein
VPEFIGLLDRERLAGWLAKRGVDPAAYSLEGGHPSERYVLDQRGNEWVVFYSERGLETGLRSFESEDLACRHLVDLLWKDHTVRPERGDRGSPEPRTFSLSGNFIRRSCFRISLPNCCKWPGRVRWCPSALTAIVTQLVTCGGSPGPWSSISPA